MKNPELEEHLKETAKDLKITIKQARELIKFPFESIYKDFNKVNVFDEESYQIDFLYNNWFTIKINKRKAQAWKRKLARGLNKDSVSKNL